MTDNLLSALSTADVEVLPLDCIQALDELQMRRPDAMHSKAKADDADARQRLIEDIARTLTEEPEFESTPLKVVVCLPEDNDVDVGWRPESSVNYLVDGFHRMAAYAKAGRKAVPVQRVQGTWLQALDAATVYNNHTNTIPVDDNQRRQQAWEMVHRHLDRDAGEVKKPWSARSIGRKARVNHQTVNNMVKRALALGKHSATLSWKEARSERQPAAFSELDRIKQLVRMSLELIENARGESELGVMLRVLQDEAAGNLGYDLDVDEYAEKLLECNSADVDVF